MSSNNFKWTRELVLRYAELYSNELAANVRKFKNQDYQCKFTSPEDFLASHSSGIVDEKDWEIVKMFDRLNGIHERDCACDKLGCFIHSVLRKSDGVVFSVGQEVSSKFWNKQVITKFSVDEDNLIVHFKVYIGSLKTIQPIPQRTKTLLVELTEEEIIKLKKLINE